MDQYKGLCAMCDSEVVMRTQAKQDEIVTCPKCKSKLVITSIYQGTLMLDEASDMWPE